MCVFNSFLYLFVLFYQEREERRQRLKRERPDERPMNASQPARNDQMYQAKHHKPSERNKLPPGNYTLFINYCCWVYMVLSF